MKVKYREVKIVLKTEREVARLRDALEIAQETFRSQLPSDEMAHERYTFVNTLLYKLPEV